MAKITVDKKKKEYEELKVTENELNAFNLKKEEEMNLFIAEIENDLKETIEEVCKYKGEFCKQLRKASKNIQLFHEKLTSDQS